MAALVVRPWPGGSTLGPGRSAVPSAKTFGEDRQCCKAKTGAGDFASPAPRRAIGPRAGPWTPAGPMSRQRASSPWEKSQVEIMNRKTRLNLALVSRPLGRAIGRWSDTDQAKSSPAGFLRGAGLRQREAWRPRLERQPRSLATRPGIRSPDQRGRSGCGGESSLRGSVARRRGRWRLGAAGPAYGASAC
jgi:hypothetical protein